MPKSDYLPVTPALAYDPTEYAGAAPFIHDDPAMWQRYGTTDGTGRGLTDLANGLMLGMHREGESLAGASVGFREGSCVVKIPEEDK